MWNNDPQYANHVLGWDGTQWAYATVERWAEDDNALLVHGSRIIPAKELLGDLPGLDDPARPPRCDHTFG
jgi:hypothetical protein